MTARAHTPADFKEGTYIDAFEKWPPTYAGGTTWITYAVTR